MVTKKREQNRKKSILEAGKCIRLAVSLYKLEPIHQEQKKNRKCNSGRFLLRYFFLSRRKLENNEVDFPNCKKGHSHSVELWNNLPRPRSNCERDTSHSRMAIVAKVGEPSLFHELAGFTNGVEPELVEKLFLTREDASLRIYLQRQKKQG